MKKRPANKIAGWVPPIPKVTPEDYLTNWPQVVPRKMSEETLQAVRDIAPPTSQAHQDASKELAQRDSTTPFCARLTPCPNPTCRYKIKCDSQTLQPPK